MYEQSNRLTVIAAKIVTAHNEAIEAEARAMERAITACKLLIEAKESLKHGEWLPWLVSNISFSERTARNYMRLAEEANRQPLPISAMGVKEALRYLAELDRVPLPGQSQHTVGIVPPTRSGSFFDDADFAFIWRSPWQPDKEVGKFYFHIVVLEGSNFYTTRRPIAGVDTVHGTLQAMAFQLARATWELREGRRDEDWEALLKRGLSEWEQKWISV